MTNSNRRVISKDIGLDFIAAKINVFLFPKVSYKTDKDGVLTPYLINHPSDRLVNISIILDQYGYPVYPQNWFIHALKSEYLVKDTTTHTQAILLFTRYLNAVGMSYRDIYEDPENGVVSLFCDYLIENLKVINPSTGCFDNSVGFSLSTVKVYLNVIVRFYKWMHRKKILIWNDKKKPFEIENFSLTINNSKLLSHVHRNKVHVQSNSVIRRLPKIQSVPLWKKLKPLSINDENIFLEYLNKDSEDVKSLMLHFSLKVGLRLDEFTTFPDDKVERPTVNIIRFAISRTNKVNVKNGKGRTIEIDSSIMQELYEYKTSKERRERLLKAGIILDKNFKQESIDNSFDNAHGRLFVSRRGKPYAPNTLETYFYQLRSKIRDKHPDWYYRIHDLRATYATRWLEEKSEYRNTSFDFLVEELASLLGHSNVNTTMKYVDFMNRKRDKINHSSRKNSISNL